MNDLFNVTIKPYKFPKNRPIKLFEAFAGVGSQRLALKRLGLDVEVIGISEIDKYAIKSYQAIHGDFKNYGAIGSFDKLPDGIDLCSWSFPCQDVSIAGKLKGMNAGTQSSYGYVFLETVKKTTIKPKVLLMENVPNLFSKRFEKDWKQIQIKLEEMGYMQFIGFLRADDYGIPQTRKRVFIVSTLSGSYKFPEKIKLETELYDYLEKEVDQKYYLSEKMISYMLGETDGGKGKFPRKDRFLANINRKTQELAFTITTKTGNNPTDNFILVPENSKQGYKKAYVEDIKSGKIKVRKLTELECWRLMGFSDEEFFKASAVVSRTQLYKQAGNSIVVNVLEHIFKEMI